MGDFHWNPVSATETETPNQEDNTQQHQEDEEQTNETQNTQSHNNQNQSTSSFSFATRPVSFGFPSSAAPSTGRNRNRRRNSQRGGIVVVGQPPIDDDDDDDDATLIMMTSKRPTAPPNSRLFVVCAKTLQRQTLKNYFQAYGEVKQVFIIKDKQSGQSRGCAYVTFNKSYSALRALESVNDFSPSLDGKTLKARLAKDPGSNELYASGDGKSNIGGKGRGKRSSTSASQGATSTSDAKNMNVYDELMEKNHLEKLTKIRVSIDINTDSEESLRSHFSTFGRIEYVNILRNQNTLQCKGSAIIKFERPSFAANAIENNTCVRFHPKLLTSSYLEDIQFENNSHGANRTSTSNVATPMSSGTIAPTLSPEESMMADSIWGLPHRDLIVRYDKSLTDSQLYKLFDIVPGLEEIKLGDDYSNKTSQDSSPSTGIACCYPKYKTALNALYAREKLNGFEYPIGKFITVSFNTSVTTTDGVISMSSLSSFKPQNPTHSNSAANQFANAPDHSNSNVEETNTQNPSSSTTDAFSFTANRNSNCNKRKTTGFSCFSTYDRQVDLASDDDDDVDRESETNRTLLGSDFNCNHILSDAFNNNSSNMSDQAMAPAENGNIIEDFSALWQDNDLQTTVESANQIEFTSSANQNGVDNSASQEQFAPEAAVHQSFASPDQIPAEHAETSNESSNTLGPDCENEIQESEWNNEEGEESFDDDDELDDEEF